MQKDYKNNILQKGRIVLECQLELQFYQKLKFLYNAAFLCQESKIYV